MSDDNKPEGEKPEGGQGTSETGAAAIPVAPAAAPAGAEDKGKTPTTPTAPTEPTPAGEIEFETWIEKQPAEVKAAWEKHVGGLKSALDKERKAAKKRQEDQEAAEKKKREGEMSEVEKLTARFNEAEKARLEAEARVNDLTLRQAFYDAAEEVKAVFASAQARKDAWRLSDVASVTIGDDGKVAGMAEVIKAMQKSHGYLFGPPPAPASGIDAEKRGEQKTPQMFADEAAKNEFAAIYGVKPQFVKP